jgi:integrase
VGRRFPAPTSGKIVGLGMPLTVRTIEAAKPKTARFRLSDGGGLLLEVRPGGSKGWVCRVTVDGRRRDVGLGTWPDVGLADARLKAGEARRQARSGLDPVEQREIARSAARAERDDRREAQARTFAAVAEACIASQAPGWRHVRTAGQWRASLTRHAFPVLGDMQVHEIGRAAVQRAVADVWATRPATAKNVLRRIGSVLRYAAAHGWRANDNPADLRLLRLAGLPSLPAGRNHPSLPWSRVPAFLRALDGMEGMAALALRWCVLTACRSNEARGARWSELSFDGVPAWTIPASRMKGSRAREREPHRVPLPTAALKVLPRAYTKAAGVRASPADVPRVAAVMGDALIFPSTKPRTAMLVFALSAVVARMNGDAEPPPWRDAEGRAVVPHGFRSSFRTWVDDTRPEDADAAERALAHEDANAVRGAYRRSDLFGRRIPLMRAWAAWCEGGADEDPTVPLPTDTEDTVDTT